jgi:hypothetical protein
MDFRGNECRMANGHLHRSLGPAVGHAVKRDSPRRPRGGGERALQAEGLLHILAPQMRSTMSWHVAAGEADFQPAGTGQPSTWGDAYRLCPRLVSDRVAVHVLHDRCHDGRLTTIG